MYKYEIEKPAIFTEGGQVLFLAIRDNVFSLLKKSGAVKMGSAINVKICSESFTQMACVDRLVELGEIREITKGNDLHGQDRVFVETR